VSFRSAKVNL